MWQNIIQSKHKYVCLNLLQLTNNKSINWAKIKQSKTGANKERQSETETERDTQRERDRQIEKQRDREGKRET